MGLRQLGNSIASIVANPHVSSTRGVARHLVWQVRKTLRLFPFEQTFSASRIVAPDASCGVSALIYSQGLYNYNNMSLLRWLLRDGGVFFDVGANIGSYALLASEQPAARIVAFEPHPTTFAQLEHNVMLNARRNVMCLELALAASAGHALLSNDIASAQRHLTREPRGAIDVRCERGDAICSSLQLAPDYLKIDVEGFEHDVLVGFGELLSSVRAIFIEVNGLSGRRAGGAQQTHELLSARGFAGPYGCDFDTRVLGYGAPARGEDCIYVSRACRELLVARGWRVA